MKLPYRDYEALCGLVRVMVDSLAEDQRKNRLKTTGDVYGRLQFLTIAKLQKKLAKSDHYPMLPGNTTADHVTVSMELPEALVFWFLMIESNLDENYPAFQLIGQQLHRLLL